MAGSKWAESQTEVNGKKETNGRVKMGQESNLSEQQERHKWQGQNGTKVKMGCCRSPPERVEVNCQGLIWATVVYPLKELN